MAHVLADELKEAVLKAAFTGKLSANEKCDSNASTTLQEIVELQKKLVNSNQIKVGKFNKEIVNDTGEEFPEHWTLTKVGFISSLVTKQTGFDYSKKIKPNLVDKKSEKTYPLIQTRNFKGKYFDFNSKYYIPIKVAEDFPNLILNKSCLLLSIVGASIGNVGYYNENKVGFLGGAIAKIDLLKNEMMDYIYYYLISPLGVSQIMKNYKSTAQGTITVEDVRNILIPFPPIEEQQRIVNRVNELMAKIDEYEKLENQLVQLKEQFPKDMRDSLLQAGTMGKLTEHLESDTPVNIPVVANNTDAYFGEIPDTWKYVHLGNVFNIRSASRVHKADWRNRGVPFYRAREVVKLAQNGSVENELYIDEELYEKFAKSSGVPKVGDLLVSGVGTLGATYIVKETDRFYYKDASVLCFENINNQNSNFAKYLLNTPYMIKQIYDQSAFGTTVATLTMKRANVFVVALPPLEEQQRIVDKLDELLPLVDSLAQMD